MNMAEKALLRSILAESGIRKKVWDGDPLRPAGPTACLRPPTSPGITHTETRSGASQTDSGVNNSDPEGAFMTNGEHNTVNTANARM